MSYKYELTKRAELDLLKISLDYTYISESHFINLYSEFEKTFENLKLFPNLGKDYKNKKEISCNSYRIIYIFSDIWFQKNEN